MLSNHKKSKNPGDNKEMIVARERFLGQGYYDFLVKYINELISRLNIQKNDQSLMLDLGCGSGYYTRNVGVDKNKLEKIGIDISRNAISIAAKSDKNSSYLVGSVYRVPLMENTVDLLLNVFSPMYIEEAKRVLKKDGFIIKVIPGPDHMRQVAEMVYDVYRPHHIDFIKEIKEHKELGLIEQNTISRKISLDPNQLRNLISMTPYLYKFKKEQLDSLKSSEVSLSFTVIVVRRKNV
jgi:23S rRNA (guanine745-N1)-methyltransferase